MIRFIIVFVFIFLSVSLYSQGINNNWVIVIGKVVWEFSTDMKSEICWNGNIPRANASSCIASRISISNETGDLLYYSFGLNLYTVSNQPIDSTIKLRLVSTESQVLAINPQTNYHYFFYFSPHQEDAPSNLYMRKIDVTNPNKITMSEKENVLQGDFSYLLSIKHSCKQDYLISFDNNLQKIVSITIDEQGYGFPIYSNISLPKYLRQERPSQLGGLFASPDLTRILFTHSGNKAILSNFNINTGNLSIVDTIIASNKYSRIVSAAFSSNSQVLYTLESNPITQRSYIIQYDLSDPSFPIYFVTPDFNIDNKPLSEIQLGGDGKIYFANTFNNLATWVS